MKNIKYPFTLSGVIIGVLFGYSLSIYNGSDGIVLGISIGLAVGYGVDKLLTSK